jgi:RHS repeat-associated protein
VEYVPFGEVFLEEKNAVWNTPFLFNGKELDKETGLNYFSARYQDPKLGIFISVDPLFEKTMSSYGYCHNNPVNLIDPTGMSAEDIEPKRKAKENEIAIDYNDNTAYQGNKDGTWTPAEQLNEVVIKKPKQEAGYFDGYFNGVSSGEYGPNSMLSDAVSFSFSIEASGIFGKGSFTLGAVVNKTNTDGGLYYSGNGSFGLTSELPSIGIGLEFNTHNNYGGNKDVIAGIGGTDLMYSGSLGLGGAYGRTVEKINGNYQWAPQGVETSTFNIGISSPSFHKNIETGNIIKFSEIAKRLKL